MTRPPIDDAPGRRSDGRSRRSRDHGRALARGPRRLLVVVLGAATLVLLAAAGGVAQRTRVHRERPILTIGISSAPSSLDPADEAPGAESLLDLLSNAAITNQAPDGPVLGDLATTYHYIGSDNRHFIFTLRHDARFSDGSSVDAQAVRTWLRYFLASNGPEVAALGDVTSIDAIGKWTVRLNLGAPNPNLPRVLSQAYGCGLVTSPRALATPGDLSQMSDGAGPYVLLQSATIANKRYTYVPNRYYFDKSAIRFRRIVVTVIHDAGSMLRAVDSGAVEVATGNLVTASQAAFASLQVLSYASAWNGLVFVYPSGLSADPLDDVRVRQALNYAVDRQSIAELAVGPDVGKYGAPGSIPAAGALWGAPTSEMPTIDGFDEKYRTFYTYDPARARRLLAAAGYAHGFRLYVKPLTGTPNASLVLRAITDNLAGIGVSVTTQASADAATAVQVQESSQPMSTLFASDSSVGSDPAVLTASQDAVLGRLWRRALGMFPPAAAVSWRDMSARLTTRAWALPLYEIDSLYYVSRRVGGVAASALTSVPDPTSWYPTGMPQPTYHSVRQGAGVPAARRTVG